MLGIMTDFPAAIAILSRDLDNAHGIDSLYLLEPSTSRDRVRELVAARKATRDRAALLEERALMIRFGLACAITSIVLFPLTHLLSSLLRWSSNTTSLVMVIQMIIWLGACCVSIIRGSVLTERLVRLPGDTPTDFKTSSMTVSPHLLDVSRAQVFRTRFGTPAHLALWDLAVADGMYRRFADQVQSAPSGESDMGVHSGGLDSVTHLETLRSERDEALAHFVQLCDTTESAGSPVRS